jgi:hypothetical protein
LTKFSAEEANMSRKFLGLILALFLLIPSLAKAESMFERNFEREQKGLKSEGLAFTMSLAATAVPIVLGSTALTENTGNEVRVNGNLALPLISTGLFLGPSIGHFYAGQTKRGLQGIAIRLGIVAAAAGITFTIVRNEPSDIGGQIVGGAMIAGGIISSLHGIYDIFTTPSSVRKYNESLKNKASLMFVPEIDPYNESYGVSVVCNF